MKDAYNLMGDGAVEMGDYDEAFDHYQEALDIQADLSTYSRGAHLLWLTGDTRMAQTLMRKAIKAGGPHPENAAWCQAELALMLFKSGAMRSAKTEATAALALAPKNPRVLYVMGTLQAAEKDFPAAIKSLEESRTVTPTHEAMELLVTLYGLTGDEEKEKEVTEELIAFHKGMTHSHTGGEAHTHSHQEMGSHQLALFLADHDRDLPLALKQAELCYENFPNIASADALAWCYYQAKRYKEAHRYSVRSLAQSTPDPMLYFHAGLIEKASGNTSDSRRYLAKALNMNPDFHPRYAEEAREALKSPPKK